MQNGASGKAVDGSDGSHKSVSVQQSFNGPIERVKEVLRRLATLVDDHQQVNLAVSGGTDSCVAADIFARYGPEYGFHPDRIVFINTGTAVPQAKLTAKVIADIHGLEFVEQGYRNPQDALAVRVLGNGWPGGYSGSPQAGGHGLEWANRKDKPMDEVYVTLDGFQVWVSGARKLESKKRNGNVPDSGIEQDKPRRVWCSIIGGWTSQEKREYIRERGLPVSETYLFLGFSGECTACSFDGKALLTGIDLLCPELAYCIRSLAVWLYQRVRRGDVGLAPKRLCWGWQPDKPMELDDDTTTAQSMVGCDPESCGGEGDIEWVRELPAKQLVTRQDVLAWWESGEVPSRFPLA